MTTTDIINAVCEYYKVTPEGLKGRRRGKHIATARQVVMYLLRELTEQTWETIGNEFNKDHATAIYSHKVVMEKMPEIKEDIKQICTPLKTFTDYNQHIMSQFFIRNF